jgi:hypothetical protein
MKDDEYGNSAAVVAQPSNILTAEIAKNLMQRSMTTGAPTSEFDRYGGYDAVSRMYQQGGGTYSRNEISDTEKKAYAAQIARTGVGNLELLRETGTKLTQAGLDSMRSNGAHESTIANAIKAYGVEGLTPGSAASDLEKITAAVTPAKNAFTPAQIKSAIDISRQQGFSEADVATGLGRYLTDPAAVAAAMAANPRTGVGTSPSIPPPPSGNLVPPLPHHDGNTYDSPKSSDGKWFYSGDKWFPNESIMLNPVLPPEPAPGSAASNLKKITAAAPRQNVGGSPFPLPPRTTNSGQGGSPRVTPKPYVTYDGSPPVSTSPLFDYTQRGVGAVGPVDSGLFSAYKPPSGPMFGDPAARTGGAATNNSSYFSMTPQNFTGLAPGTASIGSSTIPLAANNNTMGAISASPNLSPTMLGGQANAGITYDRLGNPIYALGTPNPIRTFAKGGATDLDAVNAENLSDDTAEEGIDTDPVGSARAMLAAMAPPKKAAPVKSSKKAAGKGGATSGKEMEMAYESLSGAKGLVPQLKETGSARSQMEALAKAYKLRAQAATEQSKGLMRDTMNAPTFDKPNLGRDTLAAKRFEKGGEAKKSDAKKAESSGFFRDLFKGNDDSFIKDIKNKAEKNEDYRAMLEYLQSRDAVPDIKTEYLPENIDAVFNTVKLPIGSGTIRINKDLIGSDYETGIGPSTLVHEMTHAADRQLGQQANEQTRFLKKGNAFTDAYEKLVGPGGMRKGEKRAELARSLSPRWASQNKEYRSTPYEITAYGMGNYAGPPTVSDTPLHVDATAATEFQILLDLARRNSGAAVKRAEGSPVEGELSQEEIDAASRPAFVTPKSGKGRKQGPISQQLQSGEAYVNMAKGVTELPYDIAGAPMDIAMLLRQALTGQAPAGQVGTSDYIKRKMTELGVRPEPPADPAAKGFYTAGELLSNFANPAGVTRAGVKGAEKVGQAATDVAKDFQQYNRQLSVPGASYVTKKPGGNWYPYSVENALLPLKTPIVAGETAAQRIPRHEALLQDPSLNRDQLDRVQYQLEITKKDAALDRWIDNNLTNYVKKQMGTPNDPVRKLAEDGITHLPQKTGDEAIQLLNQLHDTNADVEVAIRREKAGFPNTGVGTSPQAQLWEYRADEAIRPKQMGDTIRANNPGGLTIREVFTSEPGGEWAAKVPDTEVVNELRRPGTNSTASIVPLLGFDHIMDVLREDVTTGRIRPEQLSKVSMADAVRRTHQYDQELAAKMNVARTAAREGLPVYKSYPKGYRWIQLNKPGSFAQESDAMGHSVRGYEPPKGHPDWMEGSGDSGSPRYGRGGWEAIKSGEAKVYSLVDAKGEPHTTIEVAKSKHPISYQFKGGADEFPKTFEYNMGFLDLPHPTPEQRQLILNRATELYKNNPNGNRMDAFQKAADEIFGELPEEISQIKGKGNAAPKKEYLPFVQDFVKKGNWHDVRDLSNTGLIKVDAASELANSFKRIGKPAPTYVTQDEFTKLNTWRRAGAALNLLPEGFARGGAVLRRYNKGGPVDKNIAFIKAHG